MGRTQPGRQVRFIMLTDIEIAQQATLKPISAIADGLGITADELEMYGKYKAKVTDDVSKRMVN